MGFPPGIAYTIQKLPSLLLPPTTVFVAQKVVHHYWDISLSTWALAAVSILSLPFALFLGIIYRDFRHAREAVAHGAVIAPQVYDPIPGGISLLLRGLDNFENGYPSDLLVEWISKYGTTINCRALFENQFLTTEPDYIKIILATQFDSFGKGPIFYKQMQALLGTGVFNSDGELWKFHRAITRPFFSKDRISHFDIFDRHAQDALSLLKKRLREGYPVDIQDLASRFTMDTATEFLFAQDVQSLGAELPYPHYSPLAQNSAADNHPANKFSLAFNEAQRLSSLRGQRGVNWPLFEFWKDKVEEKMTVIDKFINPILAAAVKRKLESDSNGESKRVKGDYEVKEGDSLLDHLINCTSDETVLRDETLNILLAGRDTTTNSITYAIYMLAEHPEVFKKLRQEILEQVGETKRPTYEDMKDMKYLRAVINETLRLYPSVPFNVRTTSKPVVLPPKGGGKPIYIPANSKVPYSVFLMHRRKDLWGPDAEDFDPDRFLDHRLKKYLTPHPFIFLPFNAGPRICLGQQFAYHETSFFLIRLLQQFSSITFAPDGQPPSSTPPAKWLNGVGSKGKDRIRMRTYLTMSVLGGCWVRMDEAPFAE